MKKPADKKQAERVKGFVKFFTARGRMSPKVIPRRKTLDDFTPEEIVEVIRLLRGRDAHDLIVYIQTCRAACRDLTADDIVEAKALLDVKDVLES